MQLTKLPMVTLRRKHFETRPDIDRHWRADDVICIYLHGHHKDDFNRLLPQYIKAQGIDAEFSEPKYSRLAYDAAENLFYEVEKDETFSFPVTVAFVRVKSLGSF